MDELGVLDSQDHDSKDTFPTYFGVLEGTIV